MHVDDGIDLYMKDNIEDFGQSPSPGLHTDNGPDIWFRNNDDGLTNREPEDLIYNGSPFWVYVRVRNRSCQSSNSGQLSLHWSRLGTAFSWPSEWDGSTNNGDLIGTEQLPTISAGGSVVLKFEWDMSNHLQHFPTNNVSACLLARIENMPNDPIVPQPTLYSDVKHNNNLTMKNVVIREASYFVEDNRVPILVGGTEEGATFDVNFNHPAGYSGSPLYEEAEVTVKLNDEIWSKWDAGGRLGTNVEIMDEGERLLLITGENANIRSLNYDAGQRDIIEIAVNFLIEEVSEQNEFPYIVSQTINSSETMIGGVHFYIWKEYRDPFDADAGFDQAMYSGDTVNLSATDINEPAVYNWYDTKGNRIYSGKDTIISPSLTEKYKLEVISLVDGFKDYDEVEIEVKDLEILNIVPNPASSEVKVSYRAKNCSSAYLMLQSIVGNVTHNYILNSNSKEVKVNVSGYSSGLYKVILVCDGDVVDDATVLVQ